MAFTQVAFFSFTQSSSLSPQSCFSVLLLPAVLYFGLKLIAIRSHANLARVPEHPHQRRELALRRRRNWTVGDHDPWLAGVLVFMAIPDRTGTRCRLSRGGARCSRVRRQRCTCVHR